jgi:prepilin-type N-terminal cleavage/methylation domain-containing protein
VFTWFAKESGHSLLELLMALAIIGILTAIALPSYLHFVRSVQALAN